MLLPENYAENLKLHIPSNLNKLLADIINELLKRINVPQNEIEKITEIIYQRRYHDMFAWTRNYDVQETRRIAEEKGEKRGEKIGEKRGEKIGEKRGEKIGEEKGIKMVAKNLLQMGEDIVKVIKATGLSEEEVLELSTQ